MLKLSSNTIKVLGIFGRLSSELESRFDEIELKYSTRPDDEQFNVFRHLTLTYIPNAHVKDVKQQLNLLRDLKQFLPYTLKVNKLFVKNEVAMADAEHIAIEFDIKQTRELLDFIRSRVEKDHVIETPYIKTIWFVEKNNQKKAIDELKDLERIEFSDFYLVSNKQDDENTIYTSSGF